MVSEACFLSFPRPGWDTLFLPLQDKNKIHWRKFFSVSFWDKNFLGVARIHTKVQAGNCRATRGFSDHFVYQPKIQSNSSSPELMDTLGSCETSNQAVQISIHNCAHNQRKLHHWVAHRTFPMKEFILRSLWYI